MRPEDEGGQQGVGGEPGAGQAEAGVCLEAGDGAVIVDVGGGHVDIGLGLDSGAGSRSRSGSSWSHNCPLRRAFRLHLWRGGDSDDSDDGGRLDDVVSEDHDLAGLPVLPESLVVVS